MQVGWIDQNGYAAFCLQRAKTICQGTLIRLQAIREDPEAFQKILLVALTAIRAVNYYCGTSVLSNLVSILDVAPTLDFYGIIRVPRYFLLSYRAENIDEYAFLDEVERSLCTSWGLGEEDAAVRTFVQGEITLFLKDMSQDNVAFSSDEEVAYAFGEGLRKQLQDQPIAGYDPQKIDFKGLKITVSSSLRLESIATYALIGADILCIPDFLQAWGVINLAPCAAGIGNIPLLKYLARVELGDVVWGALLTGFVFQFLDAAQDLWLGKLSPEEGNEAHWILVASLAEAAYALLNLVKGPPQWVNGLGLIAKSLGLIAFMVATPPRFFVAGEDAFVIQ